MGFIFPRDSDDSFVILHRFPKFPKKCESKTVVGDAGEGFECESAIDGNDDSYFCSDRNNLFPWMTFEFA